MKLHSLLPLLGAIAVLVIVQTPLMAQPFPTPYNYDFELEVQCTTGATSACPLVGPFTNLLTDGTQDWISDFGGTPSSATGPQSIDHNPGTSTGFYLYTETSGGAATGTPIELLSPLLDRTGVAVPRIKFWYHMYGATMGTMHLDLVDVINTGTDGITTTGATFVSASATFTAADVGDTITISGSTMGNDGVYTITTFTAANTVDVNPPFVIVENNLTYSHELITQDIIPSWTDNIDLWQEQVATLGSGLFKNTGNSNVFAVIIRSLRGASFQSDMAIDDFTYDTPLPNDTGVVSIDSPTGTIAAGTYPVTVTIMNFGTAPQTNIPIDFTVDGGTPISETAAPTIAPGATGSYTFTAMADLSVGGAHTLTSYTILPGDGDPTNDGVTSSVQSLTTVATFPYSEDFEGGPGPWFTGGINNSWAFGTPAKPVINSAASGINCWVTGGLAGQYPNGEQSFLTGPIFDFSGLTTPVISFNIWWESEFSFDGAVLQSSIDGGLSWQNVGMFGDPGNWYTDNSIFGLDWSQTPGSAEGWTGRTTSSNGSGTWVAAVHELTGLGGQSSVLLRFAFGSDGSVQWEGIAFDDIAIAQAFVPYPGTAGGDVLLGTGVNAAASSGLNQFIKTATAFDAINLLVSSPMGNYDGQPYVLLTQPFTTGSPPTPSVPGLVYIDLSSPFVILVDIEPFLTQIINPGGTPYGFTMPPGFAGQSFIFQAAGVTPALSVSDGYELQVQ